MRLLRTRIRGFQSFGDSGNVDFGAGINLLIGQNNAGKSAFLRAIQPALPDDRHRSPERFQSFQLPVPTTEFSIEMSGKELFEAFLRSGTTNSVAVESVGQNLKEKIDVVFSLPRIVVDVLLRTDTEFVRTGEPIYGDRQVHTHNVAINSAGGTYTTGSVKNGASDSFAKLAFQSWQNNMFFFTAERFAVGRSTFANAERLQSNASNLPAVLDTLSGSRGSLFEKLVNHLREIFPTVGNLSVRPLPESSNVNEIRVWPVKNMSRVELSFPLDQSGTGVGQVIALLTAIMTIDQAVIVVDEINSFLHPSAVKSLLRIIQSQYAHHQYIISTHAPDVISFSNPTTVHLISRSGYDSHVKRLNLSQIDTFREVAENLGVSMSDVFAAERVIWVEGPTEELCFPYLYNKFCGGIPRGMLITSVTATGDFNRSRDSKLVYEIYQRLTAASASLVVSVAFSFDTENLDEAQKKRMQKDSGGLLHFLPRRNFECYLIDPEAISAFILSKDSTSAVGPDAVAAQLRLSARDRDLNVIPDWDDNLENETWLAAVDGAKLIDRVCNALSENRVTFSKTHESLVLLKHIAVNRPERLTSLVAYVRDLVEGAAA